jgi:hypothetical protein
MSIKIRYSASTEYYENKDIETLKPCPLCGKTDKLVITSKSNFQDLYCEHGSATISIECERCSLYLYELGYAGSKYDVKVKKLVKKWNERKGVEA